MAPKRVIAEGDLKIVEHGDAVQDLPETFADDKTMF